MPTIEANGRILEARDGETLLETFRRHGLQVPTLCHYEGLPAEVNVGAARCVLASRSAAVDCDQPGRVARRPQRRSKPRARFQNANDSLIASRSFLIEASLSAS